MATSTDTSSGGINGKKDNRVGNEYGEPACYERLEDYKMSDKRKYTDILRDLDAKMAEYNITIQYINNHLGNIDQHMEKINTTNLEQEVKIARNKDHIGLLYKLGGGFVIIVVGSIVAWAINLPELITTRLRGIW